MKTILSYGGGVNSTAIIALAILKEIPMPDYIVFSDTGCEYPFTYKYLDYMQDEGIEIYCLTGGTKDMTLLDFCNEKKFIPSRMNRWCTDYWKKTPVTRFAKSFDEHEMIIGIDSGEAHRAEKRKVKNTRFPLIELGINRNKCKEIIRSVGWGVPQKSGCFICPYQRKRQWIELKKNYPDLWKIAIDLENNAKFDNKKFTYKGIPMEEFVADLDKQEVFDFGETLDQKCECYFD